MVSPLVLQNFNKSSYLWVVVCVEGAVLFFRGLLLSVWAALLSFLKGERVTHFCFPGSTLAVLGALLKFCFQGVTSVSG